MLHVTEMHVGATLYIYIENYTHRQSQKFQIQTEQMDMMISNKVPTI